MELSTEPNLEPLRAAGILGAVAGHVTNFYAAPRPFVLSAETPVQGVYRFGSTSHPFLFLPSTSSKAKSQTAAFSTPKSASTMPTTEGRGSSGGFRAPQSSSPWPLLSATRPAGEVPLHSAAPLPSKQDIATDSGLARPARGRVLRPVRDAYGGGDVQPVGLRLPLQRLLPLPRPGCAGGIPG